jgi:hypothetical protein
MALFRIILRLARNPCADHPEPDPHNGYTMIAPLAENGRLDETGFSRVAKECVVRRFLPDEDARSGRLVRHGGRWAIHYGDDKDIRDESLYRLHDHRFIAGDYVTVVDGDGEALTYRVAEVTRTADADQRDEPL